MITSESLAGEQPDVPADIQRWAMHSPGSHWVDPRDLREPGEVAVGADHGESVFDADGGKHCVRHESCPQVEIDEQAAEDLAVSATRLGSSTRACRADCPRAGRSGPSVGE